MNKGFGLIFMLVGVVLLTGKGILPGLDTWSDPGSVIGTFWATMFIIPVGVVFHLAYFMADRRKLTGLLIPGGIVLVVGTVCQIAMLFNSWDVMWPGFLLAPAVGLFEFYLFGNRNKWLLLPVFILGSASLMFFSIFSLGSLFHLGFGRINIALLLLFVGVLLLFDKRKARQF